MKKVAEREKLSESKLVSVGRKVYRFGIVLSAVTLVTSVFTDLVTHLGNKLGGAKSQAEELAGADGRLPYEAPSFHLFKNVLVSDAKAAPCAYDPPVY